MWLSVALSVLSTVVVLIGIWGDEKEKRWTFKKRTPFRTVLSILAVVFLSGTIYVIIDRFGEERVETTKAETKRHDDSVSFQRVISLSETNASKSDTLRRQADILRAEAQANNKQLKERIEGLSSANATLKESLATAAEDRDLIKSLMLAGSEENHIGFFSIGIAPPDTFHPFFIDRVCGCYWNDTTQPVRLRLTVSFTEDWKTTYESWCRSFNVDVFPGTDIRDQLHWEMNTGKQPFLVGPLVSLDTLPWSVKLGSVWEGDFNPLAVQGFFEQGRVVAQLSLRFSAELTTLQADSIGRAWRDLFEDAETYISINREVGYWFRVPLRLGRCEQHISSVYFMQWEVAGKPERVERWFKSYELR